MSIVEPSPQKGIPLKHLAVVCLTLLAAASLFADELTPEKRIYSGRWAVDRVAIASDGETYAVAIQSGGRISVAHVSAEGDTISAIELDDAMPLTEPQIVFDGANFVVVGRNPAEGLFAFWFAPDRTIHGPAFIVASGGFSLARNGDEAAVIVGTSLALFGENLKEFRLARDYTVHTADAIAPPVDPIHHSAAYLNGRRIVGWTEKWVKFGGCQIGGPCPRIEALRFAMTDELTGSTYVSPQWSLVPRYGLRLFAVRDAFVWFALRYGHEFSPGQIEAGVIDADEAADEPLEGGTILSDSFRDSYDVAYTGSRFLLARKVSIPNEHTVTGRSIGVESRWVTLEAEGRFATSPPFVVDPFVNAYAAGSTGEGRAAVVYSKVQYTSDSVIPLPDVYIRIAGQHEPSRSRAVRR